MSGRFPREHASALQPRDPQSGHFIPVRPDAASRSVGGHHLRLHAALAAARTSHGNDKPASDFFAAIDDRSARFHTAAAEIPFEVPTVVWDVIADATELPFVYHHHRAGSRAVKGTQIEDAGFLKHGGDMTHDVIFSRGLRSSNLAAKNKLSQAYLRVASQIDKWDKPIASQATFDGASVAKVVQSADDMANSAWFSNVVKHIYSDAAIQHELNLQNGALNEGATKFHKAAKALQDALVLSWLVVCRPLPKARTGQPAIDQRGARSRHGASVRIELVSKMEGAGEYQPRQESHAASRQLGAYAMQDLDAAMSNHIDVAGPLSPVMTDEEVVLRQDRGEGWSIVRLESNHLLYCSRDKSAAQMYGPIARINGSIEHKLTANGELELHPKAYAVWYRLLKPIKQGEQVVVNYGYPGDM
ncbi:hypothetical protein Rhopal_003332-T1 [Rhodotorula paludigena]|uniref:SET domain-containing protein n=1 Tax=Rhodotorula paludigena TaxID=86838 RepID=A0AAV5GNQ1_9BASI|nr:hypothetical protein Rhopal_003332-T1 [Rhodotorula paludigena]